MIHCSNLTKDYKSFKKTGWLKLRRSKSAEVFRAVDNITFDIGAGEVVGYIGPNGAGKSTTIKMMCGILTPTSGELTVNGLVPYKNRQKNARQIGVIFGQKSQLWWDLPITSSLKLYQKMYEIPDDVYHERYMQLCDMLELDEFADRPVRTLSLGQRMRGELAAAVLHRPPVLILDEPTIGMDVVVKERIRDKSQTYSVFKAYIEDEYDGPLEDLLVELRNFCLMWSENYKSHDVMTGSKEFRSWDWAKGKRTTLVPPRASQGGF